MKKCNFVFILFCSLASIMVEASNPAVQKRIDTSIHKTSFEITYEEWVLFYDMMNLANGAEARSFAKNTNPKKYTASNPKDKVQLSKEDADFLQQWLTKNGKEITYLQQILQEIDECPAPTQSQVDNLCLTVRYYEKDEAPDGIGYTYHRSLWNMACAVPKVDPTEVGREKVRRMWAKHKENIRCSVTGTSRSEDLNIAKFAIDGTNHRFASELVIAYKVDFNFVDKKDGMTLLDFVQSRIDEEKRLTPPAENTIRDYENLYRAIVRNGGKHAKDL